MGCVGLLSRVMRTRVRVGVRVGIVAAAVTIGAVIGLGMRHGLALRPFVAAGRAALDGLGVAAPSSGVAAALGILVHVLTVVVLGVCFTFVAAPLRGVRLLIVALLFGSVAWLLSAYVLPSILATGAGVVLGTAQRVFVFLLLALGLAVGMRLARPELRSE